MEEKLTPEFFYGSAIAALCGLLFGLMVHIAWEKRPGGPQILFSTAEAAEPDAQAPVADAAPAAPTGVADDDTGHVPPDPLPVTRLHPEMFDVQPAAAEEEEREDVGNAIADAAPQTPPRDLD